MNIPYIEKYPEDLTGVAKTNLVRMEPFVIHADGRDAIKVAQEGLFYVDSLKVYDKDKNELTKWWDYKPVYIFPEATKHTGESVTGFVQILNKEVTVGGYMTYQVVGGHWGYVSQLLVDLLWAAVTDTRSVFYDNILNKPSLFPAAYHTHAISDVTGWEVRTNLVEQVIDTIITKADDVRAEYLIKRIDVIREYVDARYDEIVGWLNDHKNNRHAHGETGTTVGINNLQNLGTATLPESVKGERLDVRMTVAGMKAAVNDSSSKSTDKYIHSGLLPITRYGGLFYMEPSIQGTYEGSSQYSSQDARLMIEEYDGTLVRLRPGTNGTSVGVYYDYMYNPFTDASAAFIRTNAVYWPSDMGIWKPLSTRRSTTDLVWGLAYNSTLFPAIVAKGFISITNGTFDQAKHTSAFFSTAFIHPQFGAKSLGSRATMTILGGYVYCFDVQNWGSGVPMGVVILRTPVAGIVNGNTVTFEVMDDITSIGGPFGNVVGAGAFITPKTSSATLNDTTMVQLVPGVGMSYPHSSWSFYLEPDEKAGIIRLVFGGYLYMSTSSGSLNVHAGWRCTINPTTKQVVWVDSPKPLVFSLTANNLPSLAANDATRITHAKLVPDNGENFNEHGMYYISPKTGSFIKAFAGNEINAGNALRFGRIPNWDPEGNNWDIANRVITILRNVPDITEFGSAINNTIRGPVGLPNGYVNVVNNNPSNTGVGSCAKYTGNEGYDYKIINTGTISGYGPTTDRKETTRNLAHRYISYWDGSALTVRGGILSPWISGTTSTVTADGSPVNFTQVTWNPTELNTAALNFANTLPIASTIIAARCDIMMHPDPAVPILAIVAVTNRTTPTTTNGLFYVTKVNYTGSRTGLITGYSLATTDYLSTSLGIGNGTGLNNAISFQPGCCVYRAGNYLLISIAGSTAVGTVGSQTARGCNLVYDIATGVMEQATWFGPQGFGNSVGFWPTILEGIGLATVEGVSSSGSFGTVLVMMPMGNTREDFMNFAYGDKSKRFVLVAQEVTQGWVVYFTESQPVILNGREDIAAPMSIDLTDIKPNPSNTTYYVYIVDKDGAFVHEISTTSLPVSDARAYLGKVVTGNNKIDSIDVPKSTRIGRYQLSTEKVGSSIPVSSGSYTGLGDWVIENI